MPMISLAELRDREDIAEIRRREAQRAWEADRPRREEEARRRKEALNQLLTSYHPALFPSLAKPLKAPLLPTSLSLEREAQIEAALAAYDVEKLTILLGPTNPKVMASTLFHDPLVHRRLAFYRFTLDTLRNAINSLPAEKVKETLVVPYTHVDTLRNKEVFSQSLQALALSLDSPLSFEEKKVYQLPTWIEILSAIDKWHLNDSPEAQYIAERCRNHPPEILDKAMIEAYMGDYYQRQYQDSTNAYFTQNPDEEDVLKPFIIPSHQSGIDGEPFLEKAWNTYQKATEDKKGQALACLNLIFSHTSAPLFPLNPLWVAQCRYTEEVKLLHALAQHYRPSSTDDLFIKKALLKTLNTVSHLDRVLAQQLNELFDSDTWGSYFPNDMILFPPKEQRRSLLNDNLYEITQWPLLGLKNGQAEQTLRQARLHHWHEAAITESFHPERLVNLTQHTLRQKTYAETSPPFLAVRKEAIHALLSLPKNNITDQTHSLLNILLGVKAFEAETHAAQWYYTPGNILALHTYWTILSAAQLGYEKLKEAQGIEVAHEFLDKPIPLALQNQLYFFLSNLYDTHHNTTLPSKAECFKGSCLEVLEGAYQQALSSAIPEEKAFMAYALNEAPEDFSLQHMKAFAVETEKNAYLKAVHHHLTQYPVDMDTVINAFGIDATQKEGLNADEINICLLLTLEEEKFLTPATFEKETLQQWMRKACEKQTEQPCEGKDEPTPSEKMAWALMTRGATLPLGQNAEWGDLRHILMLYTPCDAADEMFRQAIEAYAQTGHGLERWLVIMEALRATRDNSDTSFFDNALTFAKFSRFKLSTPQLQQIVERCAHYYSNQSYGSFVVLPTLLFGTELALPNQDTFRLSDYSKGLGDFKAWYNETLTHKEIIVFDKNLPAKDFYGFVRDLRSISLHTLYVQGASNTEIATLLSWMPQYANLKTLSFVDTPLDNVALKNILSMIAGSTFSAPLSIETLDLSNTQLTDSSIDILLKYYPFGHCQTVNLSHNLITDTGAKRLLNLLSKQPSNLNTIEWGEPSSVSETLRARIQTCLNTTSLTRPWVDDNAQLAQPLELMRAETVLPENIIFSTAVTVDHDNSLPDDTQTEDLEANPSVVPEKGSADWAVYVKGNALTLTTQECLLEEPHIMDLMTWLSTTDIPLQAIALDGQTLSLDAFEKCLQSLTRFDKLTSISLKNMPLSRVHTEGNTVDVRRNAPLSPYMQVLVATLPHLPQLTLLDLSAIPFSKADANALIDIVPYCPSLKTIELDNKAGTEKRHGLLLKALMAKKLNAVKLAQKPHQALIVKPYPLYRAMDKFSPLKESIKYLPQTTFSTFFKTTHPKEMIPFTSLGEGNATNPLHPTTSFAPAKENNQSAPSHRETPPQAPVNETTPLSTNEQAKVPKRAFIPKAFKKQANLDVVPDAPTLFFTTQREITLRFGKKEERDYDAEFDQLIMRFVGSEKDENALRRYTYLYYKQLWTQLGILVKTYSNVTDVTTENPNNAQIAAGMVSSALSGLPVLSYVGTALQFGVDQATAWNNALFRKQMKEFYDNATKKGNSYDDNHVIKLIQYLAFLVTLRYGDRAAYLLTEDNHEIQAQKDATLLCNFIGYGHRETHPILKNKKPEDDDKYFEVTLDQMDNMMAYLFDGMTLMRLPMLRQDWEHTQKQLKKGQAIGEKDLIPMDISQSLVVYPSKPHYFYDATLPKEWGLDEQHLRQTLLLAVQNYRQKWERLNFFEQKAVEFFYAHGGQHSMKQCKNFEDMVKTLPFKDLLEKFSTFFNPTSSTNNNGVKLDKHSSLREGALHTEIVRAKFVLGQSRWQDKTYQARREKAKEEAKGATPVRAPKHGLGDAVFGVFAGSFIQQSLSERQTLIEETKIIHEKIFSPSRGSTP